MNKIRALFGILILFIISFLYQACQNDDLISPDETTLGVQKLSEYNIYQGNFSDLIPTNDYKLYELSSQLFTDYAEKQRLIKLPNGTKMEAVDNGLLNFPEGTIIVKTFYYFRDKRNPANGKKLIETRILELKNGKWIAGTYMWNETQTEANLIGNGLNQTINWIDESGVGKIVSYHIPNNTECKTCHNSNKSVLPIGPKARNLNFEVSRGDTTLNQLTHLHNEGILNLVSPTAFITLPNYNDESKTWAERGRAYLEINCAHCHNAAGFAATFRFRMNYETDIKESNIVDGKSDIRINMESGRMPRIGTTVVHNEGLELIKKYLETL
jgi:uncharacterized repeat protein (TIGR03806 family)